MNGTEGHRAFLRAKFHQDISQRYDVDFVSPDGYWKTEDEMCNRLVGSHYDDDEEDYWGYTSHVSYHVCNVKWGTRNKAITCVGCRYRRPHVVEPDPTTGKVVVREHTVKGSGYGACSGKRLQCEGCGNSASKNPTAEKRKTSKEDSAKKAKRQKILAYSNDPDVECFKKLRVPQLKAVRRANLLCPTGTKAILIERLMGCRRHGSYGTCGRCDNANVELKYSGSSSSSNKDTNQWEKEPVGIECTRMLTSMTFGSVPCSWSMKITPQNKRRILRYPLCDNDDGDLHKAGMAFPRS